MTKQFKVMGERTKNLGKFGFTFEVGLNSEADLKIYLSELESAIRAPLQDGPLRVR